MEIPPASPPVTKSQGAPSHTDYIPIVNWEVVFNAVD